MTAAVQGSRPPFYIKPAFGGDLSTHLSPLLSWPWHFQAREEFWPPMQPIKVLEESPALPLCLLPHTPHTWACVYGGHAISCHSPPPSLPHFCSAPGPLFLTSSNTWLNSGSSFSTSYTSADMAGSFWDCGGVDECVRVWAREREGGGTTGQQ